MHLNYLALAIPFFLLVMGWEYRYSRRQGKNFFRFAESIANLNVGIAERLLDIVTTGMFYFVFVYVYEHAGMFQIKPSWYTWVLLFLLTDLVWYWYHRFAHEINIFWAAHVVHHQSEDFNYTVSARITVFQAVLRSAFWCVLPLVGFPPAMVVALLLVHGLYPFFIHTRTIGKWGLLEYVLVTPSHHRVHHASNPEYLDKNYGDVLIIWDKCFGTFAAEKPGVEIQYGLVHPLNSHSFLWQHFHFPLELYFNVRYAIGWKAKWKALTGKPAALDTKFRSLLERRLLNVQPTRKPTPAMRQYIVTQTIFSLVLLFFVTLFSHTIPLVPLTLIAAFILISLVNSGAMLDQRRWIFYLEIARAGIVMVGIGMLYPTRWTAAGLVLSLLMLTWNFRFLRKKYMRVLFNR